MFLELAGQGEEEIPQSQTADVSVMKETLSRGQDDPPDRSHVVRGQEVLTVFDDGGCLLDRVDLGV